MATDPELAGVSISPAGRAIASAGDEVEGKFLLDPALGVSAGTPDMLIGEVKAAKLDGSRSCFTVRSLRDV